MFCFCFHFHFVLFLKIQISIYGSIRCNLHWVYGPKAINKYLNLPFWQLCHFKAQMLPNFTRSGLIITIYTELQKKWVHLSLFVACVSACMRIVCCWDSCDIESWYRSCLTLQHVNTEICSGCQVMTETEFYRPRYRVLVLRSMVADKCTMVNKSENSSWICKKF